MTAKNRIMDFTGLEVHVGSIVQEGSGNDITIIDDLVVGDAATIGGILTVTGITNLAGVVNSGTIDLGHATDTTLARSAAGKMTIEGVEVLTQTSTLTGITNKTFVAPVLGAATGTSLATTAGITAFSATATPSAGAGLVGVTMGTSAVGIFIGTGAPTSLTAPKGSLYINTTATTTTTRLYINTDAGTTWTTFTTAA